MVDYYPLLAKAIAKSPDGGEASRQVIFECARTALTTQLRGIDPAVPETFIAQQQDDLESAIRRVEAEFAYRLDGDDSLVRFDQIRWSQPVPLLGPPPLDVASGRG
jgi:hypothetical protein